MRGGDKKMTADRLGIIHRPDQEPMEVVIIDNGEEYPTDHDKVEIIYEDNK